jgi:hypothetical protein
MSIDFSDPSALQLTVPAVVGILVSSRSALQHEHGRPPSSTRARPAAYRRRCVGERAAPV